jgi:hypothetical protein
LTLHMDTNAQRTNAEALVIHIIGLRLRLAWDDVVKQELPPRIRRLARELERSEAN